MEKLHVGMCVCMSKNARMSRATCVDISFIASLNKSLIMNVRGSKSLNGISSLSMSRYMNISMRMS